MSKLYLFIIWGNSRIKTDEILDDLREKFVIRDVYQAKWSKDNFINNLLEFYRRTQTYTLPDAREKVKVTGTGPFLVIIISDPYPKFNYSEEEFERSVLNEVQFREDLDNINVRESKVEYRKWIGEDFSVHSSSSDRETDHNLLYLFGKNLYDFEKGLPDEWNGSVKNIEL